MDDDAPVTRAEFEALLDRVQRTEDNLHALEELVRRYVVDIAKGVPSEVAAERFWQGDVPLMDKQVLDSIRTSERVASLVAHLFGVDSIEVHRDFENVGWTAVIEDVAVSASAGTPQEAIDEALRLAAAAADKDTGVPAVLWPKGAALGLRPKDVDEFSDEEWSTVARRAQGTEIMWARQQLVVFTQIIDSVAKLGPGGALFYAAASAAPVRERLEAMIDPPQEHLVRPALRPETDPTDEVTGS